MSVEVLSLLQSLIAGLGVAVPTIVAIKVDVRWVKQELRRVENRFEKVNLRVEDRLLAVEQRGCNADAARH